MSADGAASFDPDLEVSRSEMELDYCHNAARRFQEQWSVDGQFRPAVLRAYGVRGEDTLLAALRQYKCFAALLGVFHLGKPCVSMGGAGDTSTPVVDSPCMPFHEDPHRDDGVGRADEYQSYATTQPYASLFLGRCAEMCPAQQSIPEQMMTRDVMQKSWGLMRHPAEWCKSMCAEVTVPGWDTEERRQEIKRQLQLASFMGVLAVIVPLPVYPWDHGVTTLPGEMRPTRDPCEGLCNEDQYPATEEQRTRSIDLVCQAADMILDFIRADTSVQVWVRCDSCDVRHRRQFQLLRRALLYGYEDEEDGSGRRRIKTVTATTACDNTRFEGLSSMLPILYFSMLSGYMISTEWLGEDVVAFEAPPPEAVRRQLLNPSRHEQGEAWSTAHVPAETRTPETAFGVYQLPADLLPRNDALWATYYGPQVTLVTFIVELLRRRAMPILSEFFFDSYALMNYLYCKGVRDECRDAFVGFEDALQLPLQPLSHQLPNGTYEIFENDSRKYAQYREAFFMYVRDWVVMGEEKQHATLNPSIVANARSLLPAVYTHEEVSPKFLYVVLLGCGRGPIIDECLSAASALGVPLRIFAVEKNIPAAEFTRLRWLHEPEWRQLAMTFGHTLEVIATDGRSIFEKRDELCLPADFGLCDVVVSELLGSFGDNELSPECIECFHEQLMRLQEERSISRNPNIVSIPQSYTSWIAPLHSTRIEQVVGEAARKGLSVCPANCTDRRSALFHSTFVCNLTHGVLLAEPQPCWTFEHFAALRNAASISGAGPSDPSCGASEEARYGSSGSRSPYERKATLTFQVKPYSRCSAFAGFFKCLLYRSRTPDETGAVDKSVYLCTVPSPQRTRDMFSWFPCVFPIDPSLTKDLLTQPHQLNSKSTTIAIRLQLQRRVDVASQRVWYTWSVQYDTGDGRSQNTLWMNENGWAASMLL